MNWMSRSLLLGSVLGTFGAFAACSSDKGDASSSSGGSGEAGSSVITSGGNPSASGGAPAAGGTLAAGGDMVGTTSTGGTFNVDTSSNSAAGGSTGGAPSTAAAGSSGCDTANGTYVENTTFGTANLTAPYQATIWTSAIGDSATAFVQTTTGTTGIDCSNGCGRFSTTWAAGTQQYSGGNIVEYFGGGRNLLNETVTIKLAVVVTRADSATEDPPVTIALNGYHGLSGASTDYWSNVIGTPANLDAASGFHEFTQVFTDVAVPSSNPTATVCAADLHAMGILINSLASVTAANAGKVDIYFQSITLAP